MDDEDFSHHRNTLVKQKRAADVTLEEEVSRNWGEIVSREYFFDRNAREAEILESPTVNKVRLSFVLLALLRNLCLIQEAIKTLLEELMESGKRFKKLSVQVIGNPKVGLPDEEKSEEEEMDSDENSDKIYDIELLTEEGEQSDKFINNRVQFKDQLKSYGVIHITK